MFGRKHDQAVEEVKEETPATIPPPLKNRDVRVLVIAEMLADMMEQNGD